MRFRRTADTLTYTVLWWFAFILCNAGLLVFAIVKIKNMLTFDYYLQTAEVPPDNGLIDLPDIMVCTVGAAITLYTSDFTGGPNHNNLSVVPIDIKGRSGSPCDPVHDTLTIISMRNLTVNVTNYHMYSFLIQPLHNVASQDYLTNLSSVIVMPNHNNPYAWNNGVLPDNFNIPADMDSNTYTPDQKSTGLTIRINNAQTNLTRTDLWGLLNYFQPYPLYTVETKGFSFNQPERALIQIAVPTSSIKQSQRLITTIPNALTSWGGPFSVVWGVFYALFGSPRMNPFGLIAIYCFGRKTKRNIAEVYGSWRREKLDEDDGGQYGVKQSTTSRDRPRTHYPDLRPELNTSTTMSPDQDYPWKLRQHRHNQVTESKIKELEGLLKEYYLNMELIDTKDIGTRETKKLPWYRRTFLSWSGRGQGRNVILGSEAGSKESLDTFRMVDGHRPFYQTPPPPSDTIPSIRPTAMRFKRSADTVIFAVLWWLGFLVCNAGLLAFAILKIKYLLSYEYYVQSTEVIPSDHLIDLPDITVCSAAGRVELSSSNFTAGPFKQPLNVTSFNISGPNLNASPYPTNQKRMERFNGTLSRVIAMPNRNNPYAWNKGTLLSGQRYSADMEPNRYNPSQTNTRVTLRLTNVATSLTRNGFWGLFNYFRPTLYSVNTKAFSFARNGTALIRITVPTSNIIQSQRLITTIPNALTSWGGAFSLVWGVFYALFGAPRMSPFGLIAIYCFGRKTKRNIAEVYGSWRREKKDGDEDGHYGLERSTGSTASCDRPPNYYPDLRLGLISSTAISRDSGSSSGSTYNNTPEDPVVHQDDEDYQWKLRQYRHNQVTESKINELEGLLKEYYLNMELIDTKGPGTITTKKLPWLRRPTLPRSSRGHDRHIVPVSEAGPCKSFETYRMVDI
ncbi:hypothetical protein BGX26_006577 [Mortierella sp. AD094]|nr:hypothetical protein BGX26_006577 [Mortierella sp. AD094]